MTLERLLSESLNERNKITTIINFTSTRNSDGTSKRLYWLFRTWSSSLFTSGSSTRSVNRLMALWDLNCLGLKWGQQELSNNFIWFLLIIKQSYLQPSLCFFIQSLGSSWSLLNGLLSLHWRLVDKPWLLLLILDRSHHHLLPWMILLFHLGI